jgi:uncharacterized small protein (DUF1192 family)
VSLGQSDNALLKLMGDKILQEENAALKAEVERLKGVVRHYVEQEGLRNAGEAIHRQKVESGAYNREKNETIAALKAEVERLNALWESQTITVKWPQQTGKTVLSQDVVIEQLTAEVERLRKADRLVCWNPATEQWEPRLENKPCQPPQACE